MNQRHPKHIRELDGVRALAVGLVLITHLFGNPDLVPAHWLLEIPAPLRLIVTHGWLGVDLFFVLSGFLITGILLKAKGEPGYFRSFYIRRGLRILPLYYCVLFVLIGTYGYKEYATYWNLAVGLSANLTSLVHAGVPAAAGPMWSLAVEEQFYLFWPLVVLLLTRRQLALVAIAIIIVEPILRYRLGTEHLFYPWCRFDGLALGSLLALWFSTSLASARRTLTIAAGLVVLCLALVVVTAPFGGFEAGTLSTAIRISEGILAFGALIASVVTLRDHRLTALFRSRAAEIVAELSFCLYLVHVPLIEAFDFLLRSLDPSVAQAHAAVVVVLRGIFVLSSAFAIARFSRHYLELPVLRLKSLLTPPATRNVSREASMLERPAR